MFLPWKNLTRRRLRNALTMCGILLGTTAYLVLVGGARGMTEESQSMIDALGTDVSVMQRGAPMPWVSRLDGAVVRRLQARPEVRSLSRIVIGVTRLEANRRFFIFGVDLNETLYRQTPVLEGRPLRSGSNEILVGVDAARRLDLHAGDRVEIVGRPFDVAGIYRSGRAMIDAGGAMEIGAAQRLFGLGDGVNAAFLDLRRPLLVDSTILQLEREEPTIETTRSDLFAEGFRQFMVMDRYARKFGLLAFAIALFSVWNTLAMNMAERRQEFAILRAIGWTRARIARLVVAETLLLVLVSAALALPFARGVLELLRHFDATGLVPAGLPWLTMVEGLALACAAGFVLSLIPLYEALRVRPAEALRAV